MPSIADFVGIPYLLHGRDRQGADCYGLVSLVYRECLGVILPEYAYQGTHDAADLIDAERAKWVEVPAPQRWAVAVVRATGQPMHCALVVDESRLLHTMAGGSSVVTRFRTPAWLPRIVGYYTHADTHHPT